MKESKVKNQKLLVIIVLVGFFLFSANQVLAICEGPIVPCGGENQSPCQFCHIFVLIVNIINFIFTCITPIVGGLMLILGGLYMLISGTSPESFSKAKAVVTAAIIGISIIFLAWVFMNTLLTYMDIKTWTGLGNWWDFTTKCPIR